MTPKIIKTKNCMCIVPYQKGVAPSIEAYTSTWDSVYHRRNEVSGFRVKYDDTSECFLTYDQKDAFLQNQLPSYEIEKVRPIDSFPTSKFMMVDGFELKPLQTHFASAILATRDKCSEWYVHLQTGEGKTLLTTYLSTIFLKKMLIMCNITDVLGQWINAFWNHTTIDRSRILLIKGQKTFEKIITGTIDVDDYDIFLCTPQLISSIGNTLGYSYIREFAEVIGIGVVVFDEAHRNMGNTIRFNAICHIDKILYLSAEYGQADYKREEQFFRVFSHAMILKPPEEDKSYKHTDILVVYYNTDPTEIEKLSINNRYGYSAMYYMDYQFKRKMIFKVVKYVIDQILQGNPNAFLEYKALILFTNTEHVDIMADYLQNIYPSLIVGRYHGKVSDEEKAATEKLANIIVATYLSFGTGKDVSKIKYVFGMNQSNKIEDNQAAGRARALPDGSKTKYIIPVDTGFPYCRKKLKTRLAYLMETKGDNPFAFYYTDNKEK